MKEESKKFSIKIECKLFESDDEGFLDLNDIANSFKLKQPSQWRNRDSRNFYHNANLKSGNKIKELGKPPVPFTKADEFATIGYAMWISWDFYMQVVSAFVALRRGKFEHAVDLAANTMSDEDSYYLHKLAEMKGLCWQKACWYANITEPNNVMNYLLRNKKWKYFNKNEFGRLYATQEGIDAGLFYNCYGKWDSSKVVMRVTQKGRINLKKNNSWFNERRI